MSTFHNISPNISQKDKYFRQKTIQIHISGSVFFSPENHVVYEIMWANTTGSEKPQVEV